MKGGTATDRSVSSVCSMGAEAMGAIPEDTKFTDAKVCRNALCGTCPHDLFTNTVRTNAFAARVAVKGRYAG